ncbi:hypothetical protein D593_1828 [Streptococcus intermedius BA1]|nr:hypothetical protein D593_1828 [Streptococcus intermedius BA1]
MALLYNTYLKIFRREDFLMWINLLQFFNANILYLYAIK